MTTGTALDVALRVPVEEIAAELPSPFVPLVEVAAAIGVDPSTVRRMIYDRDRGVEAREREDGSGYEVNVATLPPKYRAAFADQIAPGPSVARALALGDAAPRYRAASGAVRERARFRYEAVLTFAQARVTRQKNERLADVERRWLRNFRRSHPGKRISVRSVKEWTEMFKAGDDKIDALVDRNDGTSQRGARIPAKAKQMFKDEWLRSHKPNLALIYSNVVAVAEEKGWGAIPSYDTFWRYSRTLPKLVRKLLRDCADTPRAVLPHVKRDPSTLAAYHTIQADIRQLDVPVQCDKGCEVCTDDPATRQARRRRDGKRTKGKGKAKGHFPYWTAFFDIRSRRLLGSELSIDVPTSDLILGVYRRIVDEHGLNLRVYLDHGANFKKAFGKALRRLGKTEWDGPSEEVMRARFAPVGVEIVYAIPYNAQAKAIERMFRTFRHRFDEDFASYRGALGEKSEFARELYYQPSELPTTSELAYLLQLAVAQYNTTPHTGRGMNGRTPDEVFYDPAVRMSYRQPDRSFGRLFFELVKGGRIVGPNGVLHGAYTYRLTSLHKHLAYFGERVDMRVNPDDVRDAMIFDRRTGAYVCDARLDDEATYDTRDEITRQLIRRVFGDGKELLKMAREHVAGAEERLREYREAKLAYLIRRFEEIEAVRREAHAALTGTDVVTVISRYSQVEHARSAAPVELTPEMVLAVLDADAAPQDATDTAEMPVLCVVAPRTRERKAKAAARASRRRDDRVTWQVIADRLAISKKSLERYRQGVQPWPEGMKERYEKLLKLRGTADDTAITLPPEPSQPRRTRADGALSWANIARALGVAPKTLERCRRGKRPWPEGVRDRFEELSRQRLFPRNPDYGRIRGVKRG
jgi:putative transposase